MLFEGLLVRKIWPICYTARIGAVNRKALLYMEQQATMATTLPTNTNQIAEKKTAPKARVITTNIVTKSGLNYQPVFDLENFPKSLGKVLNDVPEKFEVKLLGGKISVPGITSKTDNKDRVLSFLKALVNTMFAGMEIQEVLPAGEKDKYLILTSIKKAGFKFTTFNKVEVTTAIDIWGKNKRVKKAVSQQLVIAQNTGMISETSVLSQLVKKLRAENLAIITGLEVKTRKQLGLPEPAKAE